MAAPQSDKVPLSVMAEQRKHARFAWKSTGSFTIDGATFHFVTEDISAGGIGARTYCVPRSIIRGECTIVLEGVGTLRAEIVWRRDDMFGLRFRSGAAQNPLIERLLTSLVQGGTRVLN